MLSQILLNADTDPTLSIGGIYQAIGGNIRVGGSDYFVTEACEYTKGMPSSLPAINSGLSSLMALVYTIRSGADARFSFF